MKMKTFKEIINSFENNDINAFETLVRKERALYYPNETLESNPRSPSQLQGSFKKGSPPSLSKFTMPQLQSLPASPGRGYSGNILGSAKVMNNPRSTIFGINSQKRFME